jgi:hypothetical protein
MRASNRTAASYSEQQANMYVVKVREARWSIRSVCLFLEAGLYPAALQIAKERLRLYGWLLDNLTHIPSNARALFDQLTLAAEATMGAEVAEVAPSVKETWMYACLQDWRDLDPSSTHWHPSTARNKALYARRLQHTMSLAFAAWIFQELKRYPGLAGWADLYGTQSRDWIHELYQIKRSYLGTPLFTRLRLRGGYPLCISHKVGKSTLSGCKLCGQAGITDEFHLIFVCKPSMSVSSAITLLHHRQRLVEDLNSTVLRVEGEDVHVVEWLSQQGELHLSAWCLGAEALWKRAPWGSTVRVKRRFIRTTSRTIDVLDCLLSGQSK